MQKPESPAARGDWIQTYTLRKFYPLAPRVEDVALADIAHALSHQCRFTGHCYQYYSVAEHSVRVSFAAEELAVRRGRSREEARVVARAGLLHDASEAYLIDVARPVKRAPATHAYREAESQLSRTIFYAFGLSEAEPMEVKEADAILLATEARDLFPSLHPEWVQPVEPLAEHLWMEYAPAAAEAMFRARFMELGPWPGLCADVALQPIRVDSASHFFRGFRMGVARAAVAAHEALLEAGEDPRAADSMLERLMAHRDRPFKIGSAEERLEELQAQNSALTQRLAHLEQQLRAASHQLTRGTP